MYLREYVFSSSDLLSKSLPLLARAEPGLEPGGTKTIQVDPVGGRSSAN